MTRSMLFTGALALLLAIAGPRVVTGVSSDEGFVREAASGGKIEVELGRYASLVFWAPPARDYARLDPRCGDATPQTPR
jgi:hypothetical protein